MVIEIWSDIMCPFCYIGKKNFEQACKQVDFAEELSVVYKSYQLDPGFTQIPGESIFSYLERSKNMSIAQIKGMADGVMTMGQQAGLTFNFENNIPANTFLAHQLIHFAHSHGKAQEMVEALFKAHFERGLDLEKQDVLIELIRQINLPEQQAIAVLSSGVYANQVDQDIKQARELQIQGVPFFLFNRAYAVSGAQPVDAFVEALNVSYEAYNKDKAIINLPDNQQEDLSCNDRGCQV